MTSRSRAFWCRLLPTAPPAAPEEISTPTDTVVDRWTRCTTVTDPAAPTAVADPVLSDRQHIPA